MIDAHPVELHFCSMHAEEYLRQEVNPLDSLVEGFDLKEATDDLIKEDFHTCPCCGNGFQDFRKTRLLGCPRDYQEFKDNLEPLLFGIQGSTEHVGKRPVRALGGSDLGPKLVRLRTRLADAVEYEDYERASVLRDQIAELERTALGNPQQRAS
jgi:protein arginine kinase activator